MKTGTTVAAAHQIQQALRILEVGEESTRQAVAQYLTKKETAEDVHQQNLQKVNELEQQAAVLIKESRELRLHSEDERRTAMAEAQDILESIGETSTLDAIEVRSIASEIRLIPIKSRKGNMQMVAQ